MSRSSVEALARGSARIRTLLHQLAEHARRAGAALGWHLARTRHYQLVHRSPYSPIPDLDRLASEVWDRRSSLRGIGFDSSRQLEFAERELRPFIEEFPFPTEREPSSNGFFLRNGWYMSGDAETAYAMVRHRRPRRVIELGSGWSTLVLAEACVRNASEQHPTQLVSFDPHPEGLEVEGTAGLSELRRVAAEDAPLREFEALRSGDILFVDTTHVVRLGGDVNRVILEILPLLAPGVAVHLHDIWLPYEYPRALTDVWGFYWSEQYLLQAFLAGNRGYDVVFAAYAALVEQRQRMTALIPAIDPSLPPSSFWIERTEQPISP